MLLLFEISWWSLLYSLLAYLLTVGSGNIPSMPTPYGNPWFSNSDMLVSISSLFFVESMTMWLFYSDPVEPLI